MSDISIPATLPSPSMGGFERTIERAVLSAEFEVGLPRRRGEFSRDPILVVLNWDFSRAQFKVFDRWFRYDAEYGSRTFDIYLNDLWWEADFVDSPAYSAASSSDGMRWVVSSRLILGVGPNSGIATRSNVRSLEARITGAAIIGVLLQRSADFSAGLSAVISMQTSLDLSFAPSATLLGWAEFSPSLDRTAEVAAELMGQLDFSASVDVT